MSGPLIRKPVNALIIKCVDKLAEDSSAFLKPAMDAFERSGLKDEGFTLYHIDKSNINEVLGAVYVRDKIAQPKKAQQLPKLD